VPGKRRIDAKFHSRPRVVSSGEAPSMRCGTVPRGSQVPDRTDLAVVAALDLLGDSGPRRLIWTLCPRAQGAANGTDCARGAPARLLLG